MPQECLKLIEYYSIQINGMILSEINWEDNTSSINLKKFDISCRNQEEDFNMLNSTIEERNFMREPQNKKNEI